MALLYADERIAYLRQERSDILGANGGESAVAALRYIDQRIKWLEQGKADLIADAVEALNDTARELRRHV